MKSTQHHIRKQLMDFEFTTKSAALQWQQRVAFQYQQEYLKKIDAVLTKYDDGSCIEIDKIVIDIGAVKEDEVALRIGEELDLVLKKLRRVDTIPQQIPPPKSTPNSSKEMVKRTKKEELLQAFLYFISQGHFPWNIKIKTMLALEEELLLQFSLKDLITALKTNKAFDNYWQKKRFFYQFSDAFVQEIVCEYFKDKYSSLTHIAEFCKVRLKEPIFKTHFASSTKSNITDGVTRWILLFAPENKISWSREFIKWYITKNDLSKIRIADEKVWAAIKEVRSEDRHKVTEGYLNRLFVAIQAYGEVEMRKSDFTNEKENIDIYHRLDEKNASENKLAGIEEERKTIRDAQSKDEASPLSEEDAAAIDGQGSTRNTASDQLVEFDETARERALEEVKNDTLDDKSDQEASPGDNVGEGSPKDLLSNKPESDTAAESIAKQLPKREALGDTISTESADDSVEGKASSKDFDKQVVFNDVKQGEFYPTVDETIDTLLPPEKDFSKVEQDTSVLPPDSYYINDGGLVLVWPYLSRLFENLKYTKENQFISRRQQERAVLLLGYIATGQPSCGEHELVFSKFLCNWPFQMPVIHPFELTNKERKEVKSMLQGLIAHWNILKNTSIEGLRETFFWREGKLEQKEEHWKLIIEQRGTDILLNHLPYGISMIKLPWHKKMLRVDWA